MGCTEGRKILRSKREPFAEVWLKYPRAAISVECCVAEEKSRVESRSGRTPFPCLNAFTFDRTSRSKARIAAAEPLSEALAGETKTVSRQAAAVRRSTNPWRGVVVTF